MESAADMLGSEPKARQAERDLKVLHAKIGQLTLENNFLEGVLTKPACRRGGIAKRKAMIDRTDKFPVARQCRILYIARSAAYYQPVPVSPEELALMRRIDELHLNLPFAGARMLSKMIKRESKPAGCRHVSPAARWNCCSVAVVLRTMPRA